MKKLKARFLALLTAVALVFTGLVIIQPEQAFAGDSSGKQILVALGDSYSSGEGIEPFFGQDKPTDEKVEDEDWLAHRSENAWSGLLTINGQKMVINDNWFFAAASGAKTVDFTNSQEKEYNYDGKQGKKGLAPQCDIFDVVEATYGKGSIDYVTFTIGGNDIGFFEIMSAAIQTPDGLKDKFDKIWDDFYNEHKADGKTVPATREDIKNAYKAVAKKAGSQAKIIVAGYPHLMNHDGFTVAFNSFIKFNVSSETTKLINDSVDYFNAELKKLVDECHEEGLNIYFVDVTEEFEGHECYSEDPYINPVIVGSKPQDLNSKGLVSSYSFHPNEAGAKAYAKAIQKLIDSFEKSDDSNIDNSNTNNTDNTDKNSNTSSNAKKPVITLSSKKSKITIKWDKVEGATSYKVVEYTSGKAKTVKTTSKTSYTTKKRTKGEEYIFAVKAKVNGKWTKIKASDKKSITVK